MKCLCSVSVMFLSFPLLPSLLTMMRPQKMKEQREKKEWCRRETLRQSRCQSLSGQLTYASIRGPSPRVVWVRRVELGARFEARGGHGIWTGQRDVTGKKTRLEREKIKREDNNIYGGHESTHSIQQLLLVDKGEQQQKKAQFKSQYEESSGKTCAACTLATHYLDGDK